MSDHMSTVTNVRAMLDDLDGGVFENKLARALSDAALAAVQYSQKSRVQITFDLEQLGTSSQVQIQHKLTVKAPTAKGDVTENNTTSTPMHVGRGGQLTLLPPEQDFRGQMDIEGERR